MKIALTQDVISGGGRIVVLVEIVSILNEMGYVPDILTFHMSFTPKDIAEKYQRTVAFNLRVVKPNLFGKLPELSKLWFNVLVRFQARAYDLIIDSNNTFVGLGRPTRILSYVHYPRIDRVVRQEALSVARAQPMRMKTRLAHQLDYLLARLFYRWQAMPDQVRLVANSNFTRAALLKHYPMAEDAVAVVYPPVPASVRTVVHERKRQVATLGRFSVLKRQLDQLKIAQQLPTLEFILMGFAPKGSTYLEACKKYITQHTITNVQLRPNEPYPVVQEVLHSSRYFLHTLENEPFGITTVEAIAAGCIPVVHDSGGQREIVPFPELRFDTNQQAVAILQQLDGRNLTDWSKQLLSHVQQFDNSEFKRNFTQLLSEMGVYPTISTNERL